MADVLIILGHPNSESYCGELARTYAQTLENAKVSVQLLELSTLNFDPILHQGYNEVQPLEPDLCHAQKAIEEAQHVVWVYPMWWVGPPAILKGFIDRTFLPGWAFRYEKGKAIPTKLLKGRSSRIIMTMDSPSWWYKLNYRSAATHSFRRGTLLFSGFAPVRTTHVYGVQDATQGKREQELARIKKLATKDANALPQRLSSSTHAHPKKLRSS